MGVPGVSPENQLFSWYSCISPCLLLLYANHRLRKIMSGPNLAEPKQRSAKIEPIDNPLAGVSRVFVTDGSTDKERGDAHFLQN